MASCKKIHTPKYEMILSEEEAMYTMGALQNPLSTSETVEQRGSRERIWKVLNAAGVPTV